jgi:hypothetical protein
MLKAHILVSEDTDVAAELTSLEEHARRSCLDDVTTFALLRAAEDMLGELKKEASETAAHGISLAVSKHVRSPQYDITFELRLLRVNRRNAGGLLGRIFGR